MKNEERWLASILWMLSSRAEAAEYAVGTDQDYANVASVPWSELEPGDTVYIHWRSEPYREQWGLVRSGTADEPISVIGVPNASGDRPRVEGEGATVGPDAHPRGLLSVREGAEYIRVESIDFHGAHISNGFPMSASGIYVESGSHLVFEDVVLSGCGNGFFTTYQTSDVTLRRSSIFGNGNSESLYEHNVYTESDGILFEYNVLGPPMAQSLGTNLKDRSVRTVIRYNWIEGGNRALDLVEPQGGLELFEEEAWSTPTKVYGNILIKRNDQAPNHQVVHFGGDADTGDEREILHFYGNTVYSTRSTTTLLFLNGERPTALLVNNLFHTSSDGSSLRLLDSSTTEAAMVHLDHNFLTSGWTTSAVADLDFPGLTQDATLTGSDPGFIDEAQDDLRLRSDAPVIDQGRSWPAALEDPIVHQYMVHRAGEPRPQADAPDLGAFEFCENGCEPSTDGSSDSTSTGDADASTTDVASTSTGSEDMATTDEATPTVTGQAMGTASTSSAGGPHLEDTTTPDPAGQGSSGTPSDPQGGASGCQCDAPSATSTPWAPGALTFVGIGICIRRRRSRATR